MSSIATTPQLAAWLAADNQDAAIEAGLIHWQAQPGDDPAQAAQVAAAGQRLRAALAARERHRARAARLQRRKAEREAARTPPATLASKAPALPVVAAEALARALAKARERRSQ